MDKIIEETMMNNKELRKELEEIRKDIILLGVFSEYDVPRYELQQIANKIYDLQNKIPPAP